MRRAFACLLAAGLAAAAGAAAAQGHPSHRHGPAFHHPPAHHHPAPRAVHGFGHDRAHLHRPHAGARYHPPARFAYPYPYLSSAYLYGGGRTTTIIEREAAAPEPLPPAVPTVFGIRAAPAGQPTLYVLDERPRHHGPAYKGRPGPRIIDLGAARAQAHPDGPRVVHLRVPRDRPRRAYD